jgi:hypothetical protein
MIRRRAAAAGIATKLATTAFPGDEVTAYLKNGGAEPRSPPSYLGRTPDYPLGEPGVYGARRAKPGESAYGFSATMS